MKSRSCKSSTRRGTVLIAAIVCLLILDLIVMGMVLNSGRGQYVSVDRINSVRALYAAEGAMNMAVRELMLNVDEDTDGTIGSVSDDGNDANDPTIGAAQAMVVIATVGSDSTVTSTGRLSTVERQLEANLSN